MAASSKADMHGQRSMVKMISQFKLSSLAPPSASLHNVGSHVPVGKVEREDMNFVNKQQYPKSVELGDICMAAI